MLGMDFSICNGVMLGEKALDSIAVLGTTDLHGRSGLGDGSTELSRRVNKNRGMKKFD
jgi:hypothetical protein